MTKIILIGIFGLLLMGSILEAANQPNSTNVDRTDTKFELKFTSKQGLATWLEEQTITQGQNLSLIIQENSDGEILVNAKAIPKQIDILAIGPPDRPMP